MVKEREEMTRLVNEAGSFVHHALEVLRELETKLRVCQLKDEEVGVN